MPPQHRDDPPEGRRYVWLWVVVLLVLTGVTLAVRHDSGPSEEDLADLGITPSPSARPSRAPTGPTDQQPGDEAEDLTRRIQLRVTCWTGEQAPTKPDCPPFTGEAALRYVFPSLDAAGGCLSLLPAPPKLASVRCPVVVEGSGSQEGEVTYSEFTSHQALLDYYAAKYDAPSGSSGDLVLYGPSQVGRQDSWQGSATYAEPGRWSVSFRGVGQDGTRQVLDTVKVRRWQSLVDVVGARGLESSDLNDP